MINLLPKNYRKEIRAAYSNALMLRYLLLLMGALAFLLAALGITYFALIRAGDRADATRTQNEARVTSYSETQANSTNLRNNLSSAKELFSNEIRYSLALTRLSSIFPYGTSIDSLELSESSFSQPIEMTINVSSEASAKQLIDNLQQNQYISSFSLGDINTMGDEAPLPYALNVTLTLSRSILE